MPPLALALTPTLLLAQAAAGAALDAAADVAAPARAAANASEHGKAWTGDASTLDPGVLETELAYTPVWSEAGAAAGPGAAAATARTQLLRVTATRGLVADVDARLSLAFGSVLHAGRAAADPPVATSGTGLGAAAVTLRWRFVNLPRRAVEVALTAEAVIPVGTRDSATQAAWLAARIGLVNTMVFTHVPSSLALASIAFAPSFPVAAALFLLREALVEMDVPTRQSYVMAVVRPEERTFASGVTHLVRMCAWAAAPPFAGAIMQGVALSSPLVVAAALKVSYDVMLWFALRGHPPPEEAAPRGERARATRVRTP